jgi:hypothetical protein
MNTTCPGVMSSSIAVSFGLVRRDLLASVCRPGGSLTPKNVLISGDATARPSTSIVIDGVGPNIKGGCWNPS